MTSTPRAHAPVLAGPGLIGWGLIGWTVLAAWGCGGAHAPVSTAAQEERIAVRVADEVLERMDREGLLDPECDCVENADR